MGAAEVLRAQARGLRAQAEALEEAADELGAPADELVPVHKAAAIAKVKVRTLTDARRAGELPMFGKQRSRTVRRADLEKWIASRRVERMPVPDALAARIERRIAAKQRKGRKS